MPARTAAGTRIAACLRVAAGLAVVAAFVGCASPLRTGSARHSGAATARSTRHGLQGRVSEPLRAAEDLARARLAVGHGRPGAAVAILDELTAREPRYLPAHRLLQDLLVDSPADWDLRRRYVLPESGASPDELYLAARIEPDRERQAHLFERALARDPGHAWARIGRALTLLRDGDPDAAEREALVATESAPELAMPWIFLGSLRLSRADPERAAEAYAEALARDPGDVRGRLGLMTAARERGERGPAAEAALAALRRAPGDAVVLDAAGDALVEAGVPILLREAVSTLDGALPDVAHPARTQVQRARLLLAAGDAEAARQACDAALAHGAGHADIAPVRRLAAILAGAYVDAVEGYLRSAPPQLLGAENLYSARWRALRDAASRAERATGGEELLGLADALVSVGWRAESAILFARAQARGPESHRRRAARRAAEERAFDRLVTDIALMARALRAAALRGEDVADVRDVLEVIGGAARRRLGRDVTIGATVRSYPFLGEFAVTVGSRASFAREFDARGLLLLVGRRRGDGTRIVVGRLAMVRAGATAEVGGETVAYDECWLETDGLPRHLAGLGGGLAGLTMDRLVLIQLDAILRGPAPATDVPLVPRAAADAAARRALDTPSAVAARIEARLAASGRLATDTLCAVRRHELGHVLDAQRMLPVLAPPWRALGLALRHGFDGAAVEAHLEARAAVVALAAGDAPHAALASLLGFLPETDGATAHVRGYVDVVRRMVRIVDEDPQAFPAIRRDRNILQQMDRLSGAEAVELGRRVLRDL